MHGQCETEWGVSCSVEARPAKVGHEVGTSTVCMVHASRKSGHERFHSEISEWLQQILVLVFTSRCTYTLCIVRSNRKARRGRFHLKISERL